MRHISILLRECTTAFVNHHEMTRRGERVVLNWEEINQALKAILKHTNVPVKLQALTNILRKTSGAHPFAKPANLQSLTGNRFRWAQSLGTPYSYHGISWSPHFTSNSTVQRQNKTKKNQSSHHLSFVRGIHRWPHMFRWNQIAQLEIQLDSIDKMLGNNVNVNWEKQDSVTNKLNRVYMIS